MSFIRRTPVIALFFILFATTLKAKSLELPAVDVVPIVESTTGRNFELYIKLPVSYDAGGDKAYPVIYIADALWHIELISGATKYLFKDTILVGVSWEKGKPEQQSRMRDYMPNKYKGGKYSLPTGMAHEHLAFLVNDVFQYIETKYKADPLQRSYFGYSVSATFGSYVLLTQPNTFKNYLLGSPVTLFDDHLVHEYEAIRKVIPDSIAANVFISVGSDEPAGNINHALSLVQFLKTKQAHNAIVDVKIIESADHATAFPMSAVASLYWLSVTNSTSH